MTDAAADPSGAPRGPSLGVISRVLSRDPQRLVVKRAVRAAIVMPSAFALAHGVFSNPQVGLFAAFGSFALLLLVEFTGPLHKRLASYALFYGVGCGFIAVGTLASSHRAAAVVAMAVVGFAVLFAGIVAPPVATASTAALLIFVLPVAVAQPVSAIGPRLTGWTVAAAFCIAACLLVWPAPWHDELRRRLATTVKAVAGMADARARGESGTRETHAVASELASLRAQFSATPYPPTGAAPTAVALSKLVGRVEWVAGNTAMTGDAHWRAEPADAAVSAMVAETLQETASLICDGHAHPVHDRARIDAVEGSAHRLDVMVRAELDAEVTSLTDPIPDVEQGGLAPSPPADEGLASVLDPGFQARALGIATEMVADAALEAAGAEPAVDRRIGPSDEVGPAHRYTRRALFHLSFRSVWFRNAVRGAAGLALAVAVIEVANVQHGFWVVLGTLSVLRSSAVGTGATALRAIGGTAAGVVIGSAIMVGIADHTVLLWVLLPFAVFLAGAAPVLLSFVAGQAAFTLVVVILFNIIEPVGWRVGLTRIEDVAIGCVVSIVVGVLLWPRGATAALGRALSDAFVANSAYLADAVNRLTVTSRHIDTEQGQRASHRAYLLLDDAYRQFFAERGAKVVPVDTVARLFTGTNRLRLAAYTLATLPVRPPDPGLPEVEAVGVAEAVLRDSYASSHRWYQEFADFLADRRPAMDLPPPHSAVLHDVLRHAFDEVRTQRRQDRMQTTLHMLWADELLENQSQMQADLLASADLFVRRRRRAMLV